MKYLDPKADLTFKKIFGNHPDRLKNLLNTLQSLNEDELIQQHHNQRRNLNLQKRHSQSVLAMESKRCGFRTQSKMSLLMRFRFQRIMI